MSDDRVKALTFDYPEFIPLTVALLPAMWIKYRDDLQALVDRHPAIFGPSERQPRDYDAVTERFAVGSYTDIWGCTWSNIHKGLASIVTGNPLPTRELVRAFRAPDAPIGELPHGFMFMRLYYLRGFEELMIDFAEEPPELQMLIDIVLDHNMRELEIILSKQQGRRTIHFGDDLGMQHALPISPEKWRKYLEPCYMRLYQRCREAGHYVYMHSDGHMTEIIPDLIECGVDVINPQIGANGLENITRLCKGKVCVNLDLDRQMFPFWTPEDIDEHIRVAVETLGAPEGGLWLYAAPCENTPLENIEAICAAMEKYRGYYNGRM